MLKFTIREAILMTTIVAVLLMWWMERSQNVKYEARLTAIEARLQPYPAMPVNIVPPLPIGVTPGTTIPAPSTMLQPIRDLSGSGIVASDAPQQGTVIPGH